MGPSDLTRDPIRAVLDTNVLLSALLFANSRLSWLRPCWQRDALIPVVAKPTVRELLRVLACETPMIRSSLIWLWLQPRLCW